MNFDPLQFHCTSPSFIDHTNTEYLTFKWAVGNVNEVFFGYSVYQYLVLSILPSLFCFVKA